MQAWQPGLNPRIYRKVEGENPYFHDVGGPSPLRDAVPGQFDWGRMRKAIEQAMRNKQVNNTPPRPLLSHWLQVPALGSCPDVMMHYKL